MTPIAPQSDNSDHHISCAAKIIIILLAAISHLNGDASHNEWDQRQYSIYMKMPSEKLLQRGENFLLDKRQPDSALMCYTVVAERYRPDMDKKEMKLCLEGYYGRWQTFFFGYGNAPLAMEDLATANEIATHINEPSPKLDYFFGVCYMNLGTNGSENVLYRKSVDRFRRSFADAYKEKDYRTLHRAFDNLITSAYMCDSLNTLDNEVRMMRNLTEPEMWRRTQSLEILRGTLLHAKGDLNGALQSFRKLIANLPHSTENMRYLSSFMIKRYRVEYDLNLFDAALATLDSIMKITYKYDFPDIRQSVLSARMEFWAARNNPINEKTDRNHFLELKDTLETDRFMAKFQEVNFTSERRKMQHDLNTMMYESRLKGWILALCGIFLVVSFIFTIVLKRSNKKLQERSEMLYRQMNQSLKQNEDWIEMPALMLNTTDSDKPKEKQNHDDDRPSSEEEEKYAGSGLSASATDDLSSQIRNIIVHSPAIYEPDFSLGKLAELVGSNRKYVSQTINERFDCNFWTLVNRARVREAMKRFDNKSKYGDYSIEGIAESVGFRSRSSFSNWFKRFTGLSAAEYRQLGGKVTGSISN